MRGILGGPWMISNMSLIKPLSNIMVTPNDGRQLFHPCTPLCNKLAGKVPADGFVGIPSSIRLRNIKAGRPAMANVLHIGEVVRFECRTLIHNLGGRKTNTWRSTLHVRNAHHEGRN